MSGARHGNPGPDSSLRPGALRHHDFQEDQDQAEAGPNTSRSRTSESSLFRHGNRRSSVESPILDANKLKLASIVAGSPGSSQSTCKDESLENSLSGFLEPKWDIAQKYLGDRALSKELPSPVRKNSTVRPHSSSDHVHELNHGGQGPGKLSCNHCTCTRTRNSVQIIPRRSKFSMARRVLRWLHRCHGARVRWQRSHARCEGAVSRWKTNFRSENHQVQRACLSAVYLALRQRECSRSRYTASACGYLAAPRVFSIPTPPSSHCFHA
eukprot:2661251-Rhodomonas_salina.1